MSSTPRIRDFLLSSIALLVMTACQATSLHDSDAPRERSDPPAFFLGGIQVNEADQGVWLDALERSGMNTVSVTDYARQGDWDTEDLRWDAGDPGILAEVRAAKERGLHVVLILRIDLDQALERNQFLWHGMIMPETDEQLASWFSEYTRFVLRWAEIAEHEGVDVLMIGSELNALASTVPLARTPALEEYFLNPEKQERRKAEMLRHRGMVEDRHLRTSERDGYADLEAYLEARIASEEGWARKVTAGGLDTTGGDGALERINRRRAVLEDHWIRLVEATRAVYGGQLGYAANFDQYREVGFWEHLDVMGINAYFKVRHHLLPDGLAAAEREAGLSELLFEGWRGVLAEIEAFRASEEVEEMPLIFTEMGYTFRANSTIEPWAFDGFALVPVGTAPASGERQERLVVWNDQPIDLRERALAVRALRRAHDGLAEGFLRGILYWKLSTLESHREHESFLLWIGEGSEDPSIDELRAFLPSSGPAAGSPIGGGR